jgi:NADH/NAD ratio-sensing transcriptional regulator Rex
MTQIAHSWRSQRESVGEMERSMTWTQTNSDIAEMCGNVVGKAVEEVVNMQTIESFLPKIDVEMDLLQVKSGIAKEILSRDLILGGVDSNFRRHSLHYSHKRIKRPTARHSMPKILLGKISS